MKEEWFSFSLLDGFTLVVAKDVAKLRSDISVGKVAFFSTSLSFIVGVLECISFSIQNTRIVVSVVLIVIDNGSIILRIDDRIGKSCKRSRGATLRARKTPRGVGRYVLFSLFE